MTLTAEQLDLNLAWKAILGDSRADEDLLWIWAVNYGGGGMRVINLLKRNGVTRATQLVELRRKSQFDTWNGAGRKTTLAILLTQRKIRRLFRQTWADIAEAGGV